MRNIILCLDGTWNSTFQSEKRLDGSHVVKPTNVLKIARAIPPLTVNNDDQIIYYDSGVGSLPTYGGISNYVLGKIENVLGGAFGAGLETNIEDALTFISNNYSDGDKIYIFGFSRGAATARAICNIISWMKGIPYKKDAYFLPHLVRYYFKHKGDGDLEACLHNETNAPKQEDIADINIDFLGIWDTVLARNGFIFDREQPAFLNSNTVPKAVSHAYHALAVDEQRSDFIPNIWLNKAYDEQELEQRWFPGVHTNVGGGYPDDGLANCTLSWIAYHAERCGLEFDKTFLGFYRPYAKDVLYDSNRSVFRYLDKLRRRQGARAIEVERHANTEFDYSLIIRMLQRQPAIQGKNPWPLSAEYRPLNLIKALLQKGFDAQSCYQYFSKQIAEESGRAHLDPKELSLLTIENVTTLWQHCEDLNERFDLEAQR